jgi:hypothetical protein
MRRKRTTASSTWDRNEHAVDGRTREAGRLALPNSMARTVSPIRDLNVT